METFALGAYAEAAEGCLRRARESFAELGIGTDVLPASMQPAEGPIKLVFVGQYSAGKSSIIHMLTGLDVKVGGGITTGAATVYPWNDMEVTDTPGIETGIREDHDEISGREIAHAALLIFVVTNEGFDRHMGAYFRRLAIKEKRGSHMVLVVNKMDRAPEGDTEHQRQIIAEDMAKVIEPFRAADLYLSFVSTQSYGEAQEETDEEIRQELMEKSGYASLVSHINAFVKDKGISSRLVQPLYTLESALSKVVATPEDEKAQEGAAELLSRKRRILQDARDDASQQIDEITMACQSDIESIDPGAAGAIAEGATEDGLKARLEEAVRRVDQTVDDAQKQLMTALERAARNVDDEMARTGQSAFGQKGLEMNRVDSLQDAVSQLPAVADGADGDALPVGELAGRLKDALGKGLKGPVLQGVDVWKTGLTQLTKTGMHDLIGSVGKFIGYCFKPWEITKLTGLIGPILSVVGILWSIYDKFQSDEKRQEREQKIAEERAKVRAEFHSQAEDVYQSLTHSGREALDKLFEPLLAEADRELASLAEERSRKKTHSAALAEILQETRDLIDRIQDRQTAQEA